MYKLLVIFILLCIGAAAEAQKQTPSKLKAWSPGYLDIYHIHTGRGNAAYLIFPDGTSMLFDAGDMDAKGFEQWSAPLKVAAAYPHDSLRAGAWIGEFIKAVHPQNSKPEISYALISHFHADHYGAATAQSPLSRTGAYRLSGLTEVAEHVPIRNLIDRGLTFPKDLKTHYSKDFNFQNYLSFAAYQQTQHQMSYEALIPGSNRQIRMLYEPEAYPNFSVRNVKANNRIWSGKDTSCTRHFSGEDMLDVQGNFNENTLSLALKISYGDFDYYTGGDNTGLKGHGIPDWFDVETPLANAIGEVDALTLDHHGNRDANNETFLGTLSPKVLVQQQWCSDQPGQEVVHRINDEHLIEGEKAAFALHMHQETKVYLGPWLNKHYKSFLGHVLIRVAPGGKTYQVLVLEGENLHVANEFGPFEAD